MQSILSDKRGKGRSTNRWLYGIIGFVVIGLVLAQMGTLDKYGIGKLYNPKTLTVGTDGTPVVPTVKPSLCAIEDTTVTLAGKDKYLATASGGTHAYRVNGAPTQTVNDAGTFTASPGDELEILWGNANLTGLFGKVEKVAVPCAGTKTFTTDTVINASLTTRVFNEEGNLIDGNAENETLGAGDVVNLNYEIQGTFQREFPYGFILVLEYNSSTIDNVVPILGGVELEKTSVPIVFSSTNYAGQSAKKAYIVPPVISNNKLSGTITIDADDTNNPGIDYGGDITLSYYLRNLFINEDNGGAYEGPGAEDEDNVITRSGSPFTYTLAVD